MTGQLTSPPTTLGRAPSIPATATMALIPGVGVEAGRVTRQGIAGTHMRVTVHGREEGHGPHDHDRHGHGHEHEHHHHHEHRSLGDAKARSRAAPVGVQSSAAISPGAVGTPASRWAVALRNR